MPFVNFVDVHIDVCFRLCEKNAHNLQMLPPYFS